MRTPLDTRKAGPTEPGRPSRGALERYFWALTTGLMSPAQVSVFFTRA
jgi:hypothetical protein